MIRRAWRTVRRAPARIITSIVALALAVAAIGVFAIPSVTAGSLRASAERDGIANVVVGTTDTGPLDVERAIGALDNVDRVERQVVVDAPAAAAGRSVTVVGADFGAQEIDVVRTITGRLPERFGEVVVPDGVLPVGSTIDVEAVTGTPVELTVVGTGGTSFYADDDATFTTIATAATIADLDGVNRLVVRADDTDDDRLRETADTIRERLADDGVALTFLPVRIADGVHPIEADIEQISTLIGLLGLVAGAVGLVLLASTTNTLITERTREVAVMRALGARPRHLRRRLRRLALGIAAAAVVVGLPLGVVISNVIARMVLQEFVGLTPDIAVSFPVLAASAAFALVGARLVSARAARRVAGRPLATALRDRDGAPFGRRIGERIATRWRRGGLLARAAVRNGLRRRARSFAIAVQIGAAVAALMIVTSLGTTITDYDAAELDPWRWSTSTAVAGPGLDIDADVVAGDPASEAAIEVDGETGDWEVDVYGLEPATPMVDRDVVAGTWLHRSRDAVVSDGFARRADIAIGDRIDVELASGARSYDVVGLHPNQSREIYLDRETLASDLGRPGGADRILSLDDAPEFDLAGVVDVDRLDDLRGDDAGRTAILVVFGAIGVVVVAVAGLAVASGLGVSVFERRHEFAALQAVGGRRRDVFRLVMIELGVLAVAGVTLGMVGGYIGGREIIASFERSNAVDIGFTFATGVVPVALAIVVVGSAVLAASMVRGVTRRPVATTLRGAA